MSKSCRLAGIAIAQTRMGKSSKASQFGGNKGIIVRRQDERMILSRREALIMLLSGSAALLATTKVHSVNLPTVRGCLIEYAHLKEFQRSNVNFFQPSEQLITTTGDRMLDRLFGRALVRLSTLFSERPGFGFVDDSGAPNAYATDQTLVRGTWGTVCFGQTLFKNLMDHYDDQGLPVMAVATHEFGHIAQFR